MTYTSHSTTSGLSRIRKNPELNPPLRNDPDECTVCGQRYTNIESEGFIRFDLIAAGDYMVTQFTSNRVAAPGTTTSRHRFLV
jgi:hypothetical protein